MILALLLYQCLYKVNDYVRIRYTDQIGQIVLQYPEQHFKCKYLVRLSGGEHMFNQWQLLPDKRRKNNGALH